MRRVPAAAIAIALAIALAGCTPPAAQPTASPSTTPPSQAQLGERLIAQEGLAIALASNVLQSQLLLVEAAFSDGSGCHKLPGGGSDKATHRSHTSSSTTKVTLTIYYDAHCASGYMGLTATVKDTGSDHVTATATVDYTGTDGAPLGTMTTDARAHFAGSKLSLEGLGTFTPAAGGVTVSLGLACQSTSNAKTLKCQGGIAQDFPSIGQALGSVTPLTLTLGATQSKPLKFAGSGSTAAIAPLGSLSLASPDKAHLALQGSDTDTTSIATSGKAGNFALFPPTPTGWTITDQADDVEFAITVTDNATRSLTGTVTQLSTGTTLATLVLDKSGTGTVAFDGGAPVAVTSWLLPG